MAFTSHQKRFIKKNINRLSTDDIAEELGLPLKEINSFVRKRYPQKKLSSSPSEPRLTVTSSVSSFSLNEFVTANFNIIIFLFFLVFIVYFNAIGNTFVSDDIAAIKNNPSIGNLSSVFSSSIGVLQRLIMFLVFKLFGLNAWAFRIPNLIFHLGSTFLAYLLMNLLTRNKILALMTAIIFAVHPIHTEAIDWISASPYNQYSFYLLLSFVSYLLFREEKSNKKYWPLFWFFIALASAPIAIITPLVFLVYELSFGDIKKNWKVLAPYFIILTVLAVVFVGMMFQRFETLAVDNFQNQLQSSTNNPFESVPIAIGTYIKLIFWPMALSFYQTDLNFYLSQVVYFSLFYPLFFAILYLAWKKNRLIFFWLSFFLITLAPSLTPLKIAWVVAERYVYLGALGIFVIIAMFFDWIIRKDEKYRPAVYSVFAIIVILLSVRTIVRNMDWQNEDTLWLATVKTSPSGYVIYNNLGDMYSRWGDNEKSIENFKIAIAKNPYYSDAMHNIATMYMKTGQMDLAEENYKLALKYKPQLWQSYQNLAQIYYDRGDYETSLAMMNKALEINPNDPVLMNNLGVIKSKMQ